eukprot:4015495-Pyramimonas_sp.AAC.1
MEASSHKRAVLDLFIPGSTPNYKQRKYLMEKLFNGDIRKRGRVEHYCHGCCASYRETLGLFCNAGARALSGPGISALQRSNWTGTPDCINGIGLVAHVHGLAAQAWMRVAPPRVSASASGAARVAACPAAAGGQPTAAPAGDAAREGADDGDAGELGGDVSVWRQDAQSRAKDVQSWILSG